MKLRQSLYLTALVALAALNIATITASGATLPSTLPTGTAEKPVTANTTSEISTLGSGLLELTSTNSTGLQIGNAEKLGSFVTTFNSVKSVNLGVGCTGLSNVSGSDQVTVNGTFHVRDYKNGTSLAVAMILLIAPVHFNCSTTLVVLSGCIAGALTPENVLTKTLTLTIAKSGADEKIITVLNEGNTGEEACQLSAKEGTNPTKLANVETTEKFTSFRQNGAEVTMLVMPL